MLNRIYTNLNVWLSECVYQLCVFCERVMCLYLHLLHLLLLIKESLIVYYSWATYSYSYHAKCKRMDV